MIKALPTIMGGKAFTFRLVSAARTEAICPDVNPDRLISEDSLGISTVHEKARHEGGAGFFFRCRAVGSNLPATTQTAIPMPTAISVSGTQSRSPSAFNFADISRVVSWSSANVSGERASPASSCTSCMLLMKLFTRS